jgi:hypothetical protein
MKLINPKNSPTMQNNNQSKTRLFFKNGFFLAQFNRGNHGGRGCVV